MKGLFPLFLGIFGTFAFSWVGLTLVPNFQIGHLDPQMDEDGNDAYPVPRSGMAERGRKVYIENGCFYCHSQQVRADYAGSDIDRKWGERRSAPRDYIFDRPAPLGKERLGPDLSNVGKRAPAEDENAPAAASAPSPAASPAPSASAAPSADASPPAEKNANAPGKTATSADSAPAGGQLQPYSAAWHHRHLYSPRSLTLDSNMPAYRFLYEQRRIGGEPSADAIKMNRREAAPEGWEIVPTYDAKCLVAYLMSLDQSHPLKEVKSAAAPPAAPAPDKTAK
ncbi:MAG: cytochrome c oxidase cbb3-type subunit [Verrucomicrobiota bacterium]|jgi:cytochrome c oxidase cbb3-type subunit 2